VKKNYVLIILFLLFSLFIYLFYRTEKTVINELFVSIISFDKYVELRNSIANTLPLNKHIIYSLPEGLWVFCITLTSKFLFLKIGHREIGCVFIPLIFSIVLEFFQLLNLTNGRFDFWDIGISSSFWFLANYFILYRSVEQNILKPISIRSIVCFSSYAIVYLAHVWK
jgi:hypothetical protein